LFDHSIIRAQLNRDFTDALLTELPNADGESQSSIFATLEELDDPRAKAKLTQLLQSPVAPAALREACGVVLRNSSDSPSDQHIEYCWKSGDEVLRTHALLCMTREQSGIVENVLGQPTHLLFRHALATTVFGFESPRFQAHKVAALEHANPEIRRNAAEVLYWDEPLSAETALIACLADPHAEVAKQAARTLMYYPTSRVLLALAAQAHDPQCAASLASLVDDFRSALLACRSQRQFDHLSAWMRDAHSIVGLAEVAWQKPETGAAAPYPTKKRMRSGPLLTADALIAEYAEPGGAWWHKLNAFPQLVDLAFADADGRRVADYFAVHPDSGVRAACTRLLADLQAAMALRALLQDTSYAVRKSAAYACVLMEPDTELATPLWDLLMRPVTTSTHAYETLRSYVHHASAAQALPRLVELARHDERESVRSTAIALLEKMQARAELADLMPLLSEPPRVTWSVHIALLHAASGLNLPVDVHPLVTVDNLHMQVALLVFG
jgi:HEAT repeat protein